jgi:hypothetical protein
MSKHFAIFLLIIILFCSSCGIFKKTGTTKQVKTENTVDSVKNEFTLWMDSINDHLLMFKTLQTDFSGNYTDNSTNLSLKGVLRIKHNEFIWISIRPTMAIEVSRLLITPDSIKIIDRLNNQYYSEGYNYFYTKFNLNCDFNTIESLLTGRIFSYPPGKTHNNYQSEIIDSIDALKLYSNEVFQSDNLIHDMIYDKKTLLLKQNRILFTEKNQSLSFLYTDYFNVNGKFYFSSLNMMGVNRDQKFSLDCKISDFMFNTDISAPFKVPESYKKIKTN